MKFFKNMKIKHRLVYPIILQVILLGVIVFFYFNINALIRSQEADTAIISDVSEQLPEVYMAISGYLNGKVTHEALQEKLTVFLDRAKKANVSMHKSDGVSLQELTVEFEAIEVLFKENESIEKKIMELTDFSITQSNQFLKQVGEKLTDRNRRNSVDDLQRSMIPNANMNTTTNFRIRKLFSNIKYERKPEDNEKLISFLDQSIKITNKAEKALAGTPFAQLPINANKANLEIKDITTKFIGNLMKIDEKSLAIINTYRDFTERLNRKSVSQTEDIFDSIRAVFIKLFIIILVVSILYIIFSVLSAKMITDPIMKMIERAYDLAVGDVDMTKRLDVDSKDEIGELAGWFNKFLERLHHIITKVKESSGDVFRATEEITSSSEDLAVRTNEQAASITETSTTLEQFTASVRQNTENSAEADMMLTSFNKDIHERRNLVENVTNTMTEIFDSSKQIDNIIKVINDISFQTNLLALNAAVEAARAGEAGRGFAVVASEVRNLAQKTAESSKTIQDIVIRNVESTQKGMKLVNDTSAFFSEIVDMMGDTVEKISNITDASREQSTGIEQINKAIGHMDTVSSHNAALVEELSATGRNVKNNAIELQELVSRFKITGSSDITGSDYYEEVAKKKKEKKRKVKKEKIKEEKITLDSKTTSPEKTTSPVQSAPAKSSSAKNPPTEEDFFSVDEDGFEEF